MVCKHDKCVINYDSLLLRSLSIRPASSEVTVMRVMRISILFVGILATILAITADSVYDLWALRLVLFLNQ